MIIKVLGTGTSVPSLKRASSAYLVMTDQLTILIDVGPSVVRRLLEFGYAVNDVDLVILTHFHVDHSADLSTFLFACNYGIKPRTKPLLVIGGQGIMRFYRGLSCIYPWILPKTYRLTVKSLARKSMEIGNLCIETCRVNHNRESIGVKIEENGKSVVFSGDTDYSRSLVNLVRHADLFIAECAFPERKIEGHMNLAVLDRIVKEARPERVIISHLYPDWESYKGVLHAPYLIGEDRMEAEL